MAKIGKCKFNDNWLDDEKYSGWIQKNDGIRSAVGCKALDAHMKGEKHKRDSQTTTVPIQMFAASVFQSLTMGVNYAGDYPTHTFYKM